VTPREPNWAGRVEAANNGDPVAAKEVLKHVIYCLGNDVPLPTAPFIALMHLLLKWLRDDTAVNLFPDRRRSAGGRPRKYAMPPPKVLELAIYFLAKRLQVPDSDIRVFIELAKNLGAEGCDATETRAATLRRQYYRRKSQRRADDRMSSLVKSVVVSNTDVPDVTASTLVNTPRRKPTQKATNARNPKRKPRKRSD
jgi:hypothetical protein